MKKIVFILPAFFLLAFAGLKDSLTEKERKTATDLLQSTEQGVIDAVKGLSDAQLAFKPTPDRWSVEECVKHIAATERALWQLTESNIKMTANPEKRVDIKATDEQLVQGLEDRSVKRKTQSELEPQNTGFKSLGEALEFLKASREKMITYVKTTDDDLRNHVVALPFGSVDCFQMILFIAGHSDRHTQQINEVKADPNFPKN